nr:hypothetical protein [Staphylococcus aureus]
MGGTGANACHPVGRDGHAHPGAAEEDSSIGLSIFDDVSSFDADVRVEGVVTSLNTDVDNVIDSRIRFQVSLDDILVLDCRRISGDNDP